MSTSRSSILLAERRGLLNRLTGLASRELSPEEQAQWQDLTKKVEEIDQRLKAIEDEEIDEDTPITGLPGPERKRPVSGRRTAPWLFEDDRFQNRAQSKDNQILRSWLRLGTASESNDDRQLLARHGIPSGNLEFRTNTTATGLGGELVPTGFYAEVSRTLKAYARVRDFCRVITTTTGEPLRFPKNDDTANSGVIIAPQGTDMGTQDLAYTEVQFGAWTYSSKVVKVSNELLNDTGIDLVNFIGEQLGQRIGRAQAAHFISGTGTSQPQGLIPNATTFAAASATSIGIDDLIGMVQAVDPAYQADTKAVRWCMNQQILGTLRRLKDSMGRPLIMNYSDSSSAMTLFGYPVEILPEMDSTIAAGKKTILFGNFNHYIVRDVNGIQIARANERYFEEFATGFLAVFRTDARMMQPGAFRVLAH